MMTSKNPFKSQLALTALCLLAAGVADFLFYLRPFGCNAAIFVAALGAAILARANRAFAGPALAATAIAYFGLALALAVEPGPLALAMGVLAAGTFAMAAREGWTGSFAAWGARWAAFFIPRLPGAAAWPRFAKRLRIWSRSGTALGAAAGSARVWALPVAMSFIFIMLFASANPIIDRWLEGLERWAERALLRLPEIPAPARIALWALGVAIAWALLRRRGGRPQELGWSRAEGPGAGEIVPMPVLLRCLGTFNAIFAVQNALDAMYLFGGAKLPPGMTYAMYAHRGAYPLIATALLAAAFVLVAFRPGGEAERLRLARRLVYVWLAQNLFLGLSSIWRLHLYVDAYSLSRWRIAAGIWMALVMAGLAWIIARIVMGRTNAWLVRANAATALAVLYVCCFLNFDGWIAGHNVRHCEEVKGEGPRLDVAYLKKLGPDSLPALAWFARQEIPAEKAKRASDAAEALRGDLREQTRDWRGWTLRRARLAATHE